MAGVYHFGHNEVEKLLAEAQSLEKKLVFFDFLGPNGESHYYLDRMDYRFE
jgi:hypothetical protein